MTEETPKTNEDAEKGRILLVRLRELSSQVANHTLESDIVIQSGLEFVYTLVPRSPDESPDIPLTPEILRTMNGRESLAAKIAHDFASDFNRNFGWDSNAGRFLTAENKILRRFLWNLSRSFQGLIHPSNYAVKKTLGGPLPIVIEAMMNTNKAYLDLLAWAENELTTPAPATEG